MMKKYLPVALALVALGTVGSAPALAASQHVSSRQHAAAPRQAYEYAPGFTGRQLYMYAPSTAAAPATPSSIDQSSPAVVVRNKVVGRDPDPNIRTEMSRGYLAEGYD
jgi:hypothetical protein